jgi:hypothetical protein
MSGQPVAVLQILDRMLDASQEHVDTQIGAVQRVARELASISANYHSHMIRSGIGSAQLDALETRLEEASTSLSRTHFDLQQRMFGDVRTLQQLIALAMAPQPGGSDLAGVLCGGIDAYCAALEQEHHAIAETLGGLTLQLRLLANNIEIAAAHAGGEDATAPVELFCAMSGLLRGRADRLRGSTAELRLYEQAQNGHTESLRSALAAGEEGTAA